VNTNQSEFLNPFYDPENQEVLTQIPITAYYELRVWKDLYFQYSEVNEYHKVTGFATVE